MNARGVILLNTGSPDSPDVRHVRQYLREFLMDPRVMDLPWLLRALIVNFAVLPFRARFSAAAYAKIWTSNGSPLVTTCRRVQGLLQDRLGLPVELGMRYGNPSIASALERLLGHNIDELVAVPLFPHYAISSYETAVARTRELIGEMAPDLSVIVQPPFYDHPAYIEALVATAEPELRPGFDHLLFSFHGLPGRHIRKADPTRKHCLGRSDCCEIDSSATPTCYRAQCLRTIKAFIAKAGLGGCNCSFAFQSRFGPGRWLQPETFDTIEQLGQQGCKRLVVICPSFVADCLETLEEIGVRAKGLYQKAGGGEFVMVPCLNDHPAWIDALARMLKELA
ncbi:MAG: ferrochelatase [Verrucomicrobiia bacterium]